LVEFLHFCGWRYKFSPRLWLWVWCCCCCHYQHLTASCLTCCGLQAAAGLYGLWPLRCLISYHLVTWYAQWALQGLNLAQQSHKFISSYFYVYSFNEDCQKKQRRGDIIACKMSSYIYPTVFVRNAANLTQLLPKASKTMTRNENLKKNLTCLGAF
jgi:hypothetical protein